VLRATLSGQPGSAWVRCQSTEVEYHSAEQSGTCLGAWVQVRWQRRMKAWMDRQHTSLSRAKEWWLPLGALEWGETGGRTGQRVVGIFDPQKVLGPGGGVLGDVASSPSPGSSVRIVHWTGGETRKTS